MNDILISFNPSLAELAHYVPLYLDQVLLLET